LEKKTQSTWREGKKNKEKGGEKEMNITWLREEQVREGRGGEKKPPTSLC
jgi:hypothetical protein